ncbi:MAG: ATP-binding protein [Gemmiger sp.]
MRTKDELFREAQRHVSARRQRAVMQAETARRTAYAAHPELSDADDAHMRAGLALARLAAKGGDLSAGLAALRQADEAMTDCAAAAGYDRSSFVAAYTCPKCHDTGVADGKPCVCVTELARRLRREEINAASPLGLCRFDSFDVNRYPAEVEPELGGPPRDYMARLLAFCRKYAANFSGKSPNLLFMGTAGLGKTHLALAIADAVLDGGHDVLYTSAAALAARLGREHFDRDAEDEWLTACQEADLLILDDLGTEYITPLTISVLYELINTRMLTQRPTIYTTNITDQQVFTMRYTEKVASRMLGNCKMFKFFGVDQRLR